MGFERLVRTLQGKTSNYDTDVFQPIIKAIAEMAGTAYGQDNQKDIAHAGYRRPHPYHCILYHRRSVTEQCQAGYVIRRILRRAVRYGYTFL